MSGMSSTIYLLFMTCLTSTWSVNGSSQVTCPISCPLCPCFTVPPFEFDIEENSPIGMSIATLTATPGSDISYSSESSVFIMDPMTGVLSVGDSLDYEMQNRYEFRVTAVSSDGMPGRRDITINILNKNEYSPQCSERLVHFSVIENQDRCSFQLPNCTDGDLTLPYIFTYEINSLDSFFSIDENHLFNISQPLDYETKKLYDITVIVKDADIPPGSLNTTIRIIVTVEPENEYPPVFISTEFVFEVNESELIGSVVGTVSATDRDSGNDGQILYSISEQTDIFLMNEKTGDIVLARTVDYETNNSYIFTVFATDNAGDAESRQFATATITINILDSNDDHPVFMSPFYYMDISENTSPGFLLMQFACIDLDSGRNRELLYSITSGNNEDFFNIDASGGNLTLASTLDYDNSNSDIISLTIACREVAAPNRIASTQFLITITGYNTFFPQATLAEFLASVPEDTLPGTSISSVTATDRDRGSGGLVQYFINNDAMQSQSCPFDKLSIDENSGYIYLLSPLDYEDGYNELYCVVTIWNSGYPEKASQADLFVSVTDVNDNEPKCFPSACVVYVAEDTVIGDIVFSLPCNDTDTLSLQYSVENDFFTVSSTGNLILHSHLDFETKSFHLLSILVSDGMFVTNATIRVIVEPVNEYIPVFSQPIFHCSVEENTPIGTVLPCNITAEDQDSGRDGEIHYRLQYYSPFLFDSENMLFLTANIDFEAQQAHISHVEVYDMGNPSFSSTALINLTVLDRNDNNPKMFSLLSESITENSLPGTLITNLLCTDTDEGSNGATNIHLSEVFQMRNNTFVNVTDLVLFNVNNSNLHVSGEIDFETSSKYKLNFLCTDHGVPPLSASSTLFLDVISENEFSPIFVNPLLSIEIPEATNLGEVISRVIAVDKDAGKDGDILFSLNKSPFFEPFPFDINDISGEIILLHPINCEENIQYVFDVVAKDRGALSRSSLCTVVINVTTCHLGNLFPDHFIYSFSIQENTPRGETVGSVSCLSNRANIATTFTPLYQVVSNNTNHNFGVNNSNGDIIVINPPDFELKIEMKIVIECYDPNFREIAANVTVYIFVLPENEFPPTFARSNLIVNVVENTPIGTSIMQLHATDQDIGLDGEIEFSIASEDCFKVIVNEHTGEVYLITNLDREITSEITFIAIASDSPVTEEMKRSSTALVTITIEDQNDNWPICNPIVHHVIISPRTEPPYTIIDTFDCVDNDINKNAEKNYQFSDNTVPTDLFQLSVDRLLLISKLNASGPSQYNIPISVFDEGIPSFATNLLVIIDVYEPDFTVQNDINYTARIETEGLENAIWIHLNDVTLSLSQNEVILQKFQQVIALSVTHYCALFPEACSLISGCSEFFGIQQKRSVSNNYVVFDKQSVVVLSEDPFTPITSGSDTSLDVLFYVTIPVDSSRSQYRETDYVIPRATMSLIVEQDGSTIEAVVRDSVAQQQPLAHRQQQEWTIIVSLASGVVGSFLLIAFVFFAISVRKRLKRNKTVAPSTNQFESHNQDSVNSKRQSITSSMSSVSNKATCNDNRLNSSRILRIFKQKSSDFESNVELFTLPSKEETRMPKEHDIFIEDFDEHSFCLEKDDSSGQTSMENISSHEKQDIAPRTLITSLLNRKGSS